MLRLIIMRTCVRVCVRCGRGRATLELGSTLFFNRVQRWGGVFLPRFHHLERPPRFMPPAVAPPLHLNCQKTAAVSKHNLCL